MAARTTTPVAGPRVLDRALIALAAALGIACIARVLVLAPEPALAEMVASNPGDVVALTADSGSEDVLLVLDNRAERLMVYKLTQNGLQLYSSEPLRELFTRARASAPQ